MNNLKNIFRKARRIGSVLKGEDRYFKRDCAVDSIRLGSDYGGWVIEDSLDAHSTVLSFGVGKDISFDQAVISKYECNVYMFDPTHETRKWIESQNISHLLSFTPKGVSNYDGIAKFAKPKPRHCRNGSRESVYINYSARTQ